MMKAKLRCFLPAITVCGILFVSVQPATAFELFARRLGQGAGQKCDACQKDAVQKGAVQKGACQKGACQKGAVQKRAVQKSAVQKGVYQKGAYQKTPHQKSWSSHQKGGKGKGKSGQYGEGFDSTPDSGVPLPAPLASTASAFRQPVGNDLGERPRSAIRIRPRQAY